MKKILSLVIVVILAGGLWWAMHPSGFDTGAPLVSQGDAIDLLQDLDTDNLSEGWVHRTFFTASAAEYQMTQEDGAVALRCATTNSASILARDTQISLEALPFLHWQWKVTKPIESDVDEASKEGDDHPVRLFLVFSNESGDRNAMEIIWSNKKYAPGDYKIIGDFYHYVANGLNENIGEWHSQTVDLRQIYSDIGGTGTPTLQVLGFFCDSDNTGAQSEGFFRDVRLSDTDG
ncbi:MAG: DUF3047 domain-containing protein [Paracoccaceae bacterium]